MNDGDNKPSHMYHERHTQNEIGVETICTHPHENSSHYIYRPFQGTKNHQTERFNNKDGQFTESYVPKNTHTPMMESDSSSDHQSQQLYASDPESLKSVSTGKCPKREHIVDLTFDSPSRKKPFKRCRITNNSHQAGSAQSHYSTTSTYGSRDLNFLSPELKHWMSFNSIKHIIVSSKDSPDISERIDDMSHAAASISDDIMALLNIKLDHTNIHSVHLKDHNIDSPIPSLGNTNKMHGYSSKSALVFVSTIRSATIGDTILLVSLGNNGISNSPRAWVDLRENYPAYKFLIAIQERRNSNPHPDPLWQITKK
ncbi:hypothetical protein BPAE_0021g00400 [Botrytis paeoniae]|uniref:Uncharacterized protein n=1 Tax=Botrytis paeoniae TaxID=278948 RepID=A0A4Z1FWM4_9HELO|nr:hypothetical protein BPAE_0021g00400 [Botrytis paeoniae]